MGEPALTAIPGIPIAVATLRSELLGKTMRRLSQCSQGGLDLELAQGADSLWVLIRRKGAGGLALRAAYTGANAVASLKAPQLDERLSIEALGPLGRHIVRIWLPKGDEEGLRLTCTLTPAEDLLLP